MNALVTMLVSLALAVASPGACAHAFASVGARSAPAAAAHDMSAHHHGHGAHHEAAAHDHHPQSSRHDCEDDCDGGPDCGGCAYAPNAVLIDAVRLSLRAAPPPVDAGQIRAAGLAPTPLPPPPRI